MAYELKSLYLCLFKNQLKDHLCKECFLIVCRKKKEIIESTTVFLNFPNIHTHMMAVLFGLAFWESHENSVLSLQKKSSYLAYNFKKITDTLKSR